MSIHPYTIDNTDWVLEGKQGGVNLVWIQVYCASMIAPVSLFEVAESIPLLCPNFKL